MRRCESRVAGGGLAEEDVLELLNTISRGTMVRHASTIVGDEGSGRDNREKFNNKNEIEERCQHE